MKLKKKVKNWVKRSWLSALVKVAIRKGIPSAPDPKLQDLAAWNIYQSLNDLPYEVFKKCRVEGKYELLKLNFTDYVPDMILERSWVHLFSEFCEISEDVHSEAMISQLAKAKALESRILRVKVFCMAITEHWSQYYADKLRGLGYHFQFTEQSTIADVERVLRKLNNQELELSNLTSAIAKSTVQNGDDVKLGYAMFDDHINQIERAFKVPVDTTKLSAQMYAIKLRDLRNHYDYLREKEEADA